MTQTFRGVSSGRDGTRGLLERLLERLRVAAPDERPTRVLMIRLDRLGRGLGIEALAAIAEIVRLGVTIHTRQDGDYSLIRASDSILPLMRVVTGAIENEARRDKARSIYARRRAKGETVSNKRPYGLRRCNGKDVADEPRAAAVRYAFDLAANGYGLSAIGRRLSSVAPDKVYANGRRHNTHWDPTRVARLLRNRAYLDVIVEPALWDRVQAMRTPRSRVVARHPWPLSGVLHCECGRLLIGSLSGSPSRRVYRCAQREIHGRNLIRGAKKLEMAFVALLHRLTVSDELASLYRDESPSTLQLSALNERAEQITARLHGLEAERKRVWQLNRDGLLADRELSRRLSELSTEAHTAEHDAEVVRGEIIAAQERTKALLTASELVAQAAQLWTGGSVDQQRTCAQALARAVGGLYVNPRGEIVLGAPSQSSRFLRPS